MKAGDLLGSYVVVREIGSGGMGSVYLAEHTALGRRAAIKVLQPELTSNQQMLTRFFNEARAASAIKSPGIVEIYDFGRSPDGSAYIVMELLDGEPLSARLARLGKLPLGNALVIARQIASALAPAHRAGIVHRDLKPDNVFLVPDAEVAAGERVKLLDFGIAKLLGDDERSGGKLTTTKMVMGTPHYMSPEQCRGAGGVDARTDLYALGCILFELLTGQPPFIGEGAGDLIGAHIYLPPRRLSELLPELPVALDQLVQRLLAKAANQRPQNAEEVSSALSALVSRFSAPTALPANSPPALSPLPTVAQVALPRESPQDPTTLMAGVSRAPRTVATKTTAIVKAAVAVALFSLVAVGVHSAIRGAGGGSTELAQRPPVEDRIEGDSGPSGVTPAADASVASQRDAAVALVRDAGSDVAAKDAALAQSGADAGAPATAEAATKRSECHRLQTEERWLEAYRCGAALRAIKGAKPVDVAFANELIRVSGVEAAARTQLDKYALAARRSDIAGMASLVESMNQASRYAPQLAARWEADKKRIVAGKRDAALSAVRNKECGALRGLSASVRPLDSSVADEIDKMLCVVEPVVDCLDPTVLAATNREYEEIQSMRVADPAKAIPLVVKAFDNKCLKHKWPILARIGVVVACSEKKRDKVELFFNKTKDSSLVQACPQYLGDLEIE